MSDNISNNKKIAVNSLYVFLRLAFTALVSIFTARWVLATLGAENYGIYNVVGSIVVFLNVINTAMTTTTYRYIAFEMGKGNECDVNAVFNRSLVIHICLALLIVILSEIFGVFYVNNYLNIAADKYADAHFVLQVSTITTAISALSVPFQGLLTANEKFSIITFVVILSDIFKVVAVLWLMHYAGNALRAYSIIIFLVAAIPFLLYWLICNIKYNRYIKWNLQRSWHQYKELISFSTWILLGAVSSIARHQGAQIIINFLWGPMLNAAFAVANQVNHVLQMFSNNISVAANPQITKSYSGGDQNRTINLACTISKISAFILMIVGLPFFIETEFVFNLWLKDVPEYAVTFCRLMTILALIDTLGAGIPALTQATGKIKVFQIVGAIWSLSNLPIAFYVYKMGGRPESITIIYIITASLYVGVRLYLLKRILNFDVKYFVTESYLRIIYVLLPLIAWILIYHHIPMTGWQVVLGLIISEILLLIFIYYFGFKKEDRMRILNVIKTYINKIKIWKR